MAVVAIVVMARRLLLSTHGRALLAIREDEVAAEAMGVDTTGYKVRAFVISAFFAGVAGGLFAHRLQLITPSMFTFVKSIEVVVMMVLGGLGSITGSVVAAAVLTVALEGLRGARSVPHGDLRGAAHRPHADPAPGLFGTRELWDARRAGSGGAPAGGRRERGSARRVLEARGRDHALRGPEGRSPTSTSPLRPGELVGPDRPQRRRQDHRLQRCSPASTRPARARSWSAASGSTAGARTRSAPGRGPHLPEHPPLPGRSRCSTTCASPATPESRYWFSSTPAAHAPSHERGGGADPRRR